MHSAKFAGGEAHVRALTRAGEDAERLQLSMVGTADAHA
jgi:AhpD family alkylhydroperoxidase